MGLHKHGAMSLTEKLVAAVNELVGEVNRLNASMKALARAPSGLEDLTPPSVTIKGTLWTDDTAAADHFQRKAYELESQLEACKKMGLHRLKRIQELKNERDEANGENNRIRFMIRELNEKAKS